MLQTIVPRVLLGVLFIAGSWITYTESVYLQDQFAEIGAAKIGLWMWVFRGITFALVLSALLLGAGIVRKILS